MFSDMMFDQNLIGWSRKLAFSWWGGRLFWLRLRQTQAAVFRLDILSVTSTCNNLCKKTLNFFNNSESNFCSKKWKQVTKTPVASWLCYGASYKSSLLLLLSGPSRATGMTNEMFFVTFRQRNDITGIFKVLGSSRTHLHMYIFSYYHSGKSIV